MHDKITFSSTRHLNYMISLYAQLCRKTARTNSLPQKPTNEYMYTAEDKTQVKKLLPQPWSFVLVCQ